MKFLEAIKDTCTGCFACYNACTQNAISMPEDKEGFYQPFIDDKLCINCGICEKVCPIINKDNNSKRVNFQAYYGYSSNNEIRNVSSSGGAFSAIAQQILGRNGVVYGASFIYNDIVRLEHRSTEYVSLSSLRKSKYVQSYVGYAYRSVEKDLFENKLVLFVGTPCQIAGLKYYLQKDNNNLITMDFICHGVPSMDLFLRTLEYNKSDIKNITNIDFRYRSSVGNIGNLNLNISFKSGKSYISSWINDPFYFGFEKNITLRRSCYNCIFCNGLNKYSDITIADFWEVKKINPLINASEGVSLILLNNFRYENIIKEIRKNSFFIQKIDNDYAEYVYEKKRHKGTNYDIDLRNRFFETLIKFGFKKAVKQLRPKRTLKEKISYIMRKIKNFL